MKLRSVLVLSIGLLLSIGLCAATLRFAAEPFPPFSYEENGKGAGPMAEVVQAVCDRLKADCVISVFPWRRALQMAEDGELDGAFGLGRTPERERVFHLTDPVVKTTYEFFAVESASFAYRQPKDLDGYTIGVYGPSALAAALEELTKGMNGVNTIVEVNNPIAMRKLSVGRYGDKGLVFLNRDVGLYIARQEDISNIKPVGSAKKTQYMIGLVRKRVTESQANQFNEALRTLIKEGKVKAILEKYGMAPAD